MNKKNKQIWKKYYAKNFTRAAMKRLHLGKLAPRIKYKKQPHDIEMANSIIYNKLISNKPFMAGRFGETEARATADALGIKYGAKKKPEKKRLDTLYNNAGVFPYGAEMEMRFAECMEEYIPEVDVLCIWETFMQDLLINEYTSADIDLVPLKTAEPYYSKDPWSKGLEGKKVLVIHPFVKSISSQYNKRELLFENKDILPKFELKTLKAVQTIAGQKDERFNDWFEALDYMYNEALKIDFDVAIIGCGAYGFPLAARLKQAGKQAIHMGGATQILFGIKGNRWDKHPVISKFYNEHWVRPLPEEGLKTAGKVEGACYW